MQCHQDKQCASHCPKSSAIEAEMALIEKLQAFFDELTSTPEDRVIEVVIIEPSGIIGCVAHERPKDAEML